MSVKYSWSRQNGAAVPPVRFMSIEPAEDYYKGMPLKLKEKGIVEPTDGDPEYICMAQYDPDTEIQPLEIPVQEVFPDVVYDRMNEDGTTEEVRFGSKGGGGAILDSNGKLKSEVLPEGYPYEEITVNSRLDIEASILTSKYEHYNGPVFYGDDVVISAYAGKGVTYSRGRWTLPDGYNWYCTIDGEEIKIPQLNELEYARQNVLGDTFDGYEVKVKPLSATIFVDGVQKNNSVLLLVTIVGYGADNPLPDIQLEYRKVEIEPLDTKFLPEGIGGGGDNLFLITITMKMNISDGSSSTSCNKTYEQILDAYNGGKVIVLRYVFSAGDMQRTAFLTSMVALGNNQEFMFRYNTPDGGLYSIYIHPDNTIEEDNTTYINWAEISNSSGFIMRSGTPGSEKKFRITVDDNGAIAATEV